MSIDFKDTIDSVKDGTMEVASELQTKINEFHKNYTTKVMPECGKYGEEAKFAAELIPGVAEYNAAREGNWQEFAIAAGVDAAALGAGVVTAGAGFVAVKGGSVAARQGLKVAVKETSKASGKTALKETTETGVEKVARETAETGVEKVGKEVDNAKFIDDNGNVYRTKDSLYPNKTIEKNGYIYKTDEQGRVSSAEGKLQIKDHEGRRPYERREVVGKGEMKGSDDVGHLIADRFNGSGGLENLSQMDRNLNQKKFFAMEDTWDKALKDGKEVYAKIEPRYLANSNRSKDFKVTYTIDGEKTIEILKNK